MIKKHIRDFEIGERFEFMDSVFEITGEIEISRNGYVRSCRMISTRHKDQIVRGLLSIKCFIESILLISLQP